MRLRKSSSTLLLFINETVLVGGNGKVLADGGTEKLINTTIIRALPFLGFVTDNVATLEAAKISLMSLLNLIKFRYEPLTASFTPPPFCLPTFVFKSIDLSSRLYWEIKVVISSDNSSSVFGLAINCLK